MAHPFPFRSCKPAVFCLGFVFLLTTAVGPSSSFFSAFIVSAQTPLEKLLADLKNPDVTTRRKAAKELGERRFREAGGSLAEAARTDADPEVRASSLVSLGRLKDTEAVPTIIGALKDPVADVRRGAIRALVSYHIESDIGFIFAERKGWNVLNPFFDTDGPSIVEPYTQVDPRMLEALADTMRNDADVSLRRSGVRALGVLRGASQVPALASALQVDPDLRVDVLRVFIKFGDSENGAYAIPYFNDDNREVRAQAIFTAGYLRTGKAVEELNKTYRLGEDKRGFKASVNDFFKKVPERQRITLEALALLGDPTSKDIFEQNLRSGDDDRRQLANEGLARMDDANFLEIISRNRLREGDNNVRLAQAFALYRLGRPEFLDEVVKELDAVTLGDQAEGYVRDVLKPSDLHPYLRTAMVGAAVKLLKTLGQIGTSADLPALEPSLRDANPRVVNAANLAIQRIKLREQYQRGELPQKPPVVTPDDSKRPRRVVPKEGGDGE